MPRYNVSVDRAKECFSFLSSILLQANPFLLFLYNCLKYLCLQSFVISDDLLSELKIECFSFYKWCPFVALTRCLEGRHGGWKRFLRFGRSVRIHLQAKRENIDNNHALIDCLVAQFLLPCHILNEKAPWTSLLWVWLCMSWSINSTHPPNTHIQARLVEHMN